MLGRGPVPYYRLLTEDELLEFMVLKRKRDSTAEEADLLASLYRLSVDRYPLVLSAGNGVPEPHPLQDRFVHAGEDARRVRRPEL